MNKAILADETFASAAVASLIHAARTVSAQAFERAGDYDEDGAYPTADIDALKDAGLLTATLPLAFGGAGVGGAALCDILRQIGSGSLPLGRLFEGHVNAVGLVLRYGSADQISLIARETHEGKMSGVWNTDDHRNLRLISSCRGGAP
jgi:alkylation response protein AidB-like acyl-CoA dehydrogenase